MGELLKRLFASCLVAFCCTMLLLIGFRLFEPIARPNSLLLAAGDLLLFWPTRFHVFGISGCPSVDRLGRVRCLEIAFGIDVITYAILCFPLLSLLQKFKAPR
jgi:hypothetical protein